MVLQVTLAEETDELIYEQPKLKRMTWNDLAFEYENARFGGRPAKTLPMDVVLDWALKQEDKFKTDSEGYLCLIVKEEETK